MAKARDDFIELEMYYDAALVVSAASLTYLKDRISEDDWDALEELGTFARIYELVTSRSGPPRLIVKKPTP